MTTDGLYREHVETLAKRYTEAIELAASDGHVIEAVLLHSGSETVYFSDDQHVPFVANAHFRQWAPVNRPDQMVLFEPSRRPVYFQVVPADFWYDQTICREDWWAECFDVVELSAPEQVLDRLPAKRRIAFLGENTAFASSIGLPSTLQNEDRFVASLAYFRSLKTAYEVGRVREANRVALGGHDAARAAFDAGASEWEIHMEYLRACGYEDCDLPFPNIIALDEKSAILHYQNKRRGTGRTSRVLLIDAGARSSVLCSDITRTHVRTGAHPVFEALWEGMAQVQREMVAAVRAATAFPDLQFETHRKILNLLRQTDVYVGSAEEAEAQKISRLFFPHGLGHLLGIQVHDVGGRVGNVMGEIVPPPADFPNIRLTRVLEAGMVITIEPGIYFIPALLDPERSSEKGRLLDWKLIDGLLPLGGIRIEDDVLVTTEGRENLTRGPAGA